MKTINKKIPSVARFERSYRKADEFLVVQGISKLPFDPYETLIKIGCKIYTYGELANKSGVTVSDIIDEFGSEDGITFYNAKTKQYVVAYNENKILSRIRWTLTHELAHIVLDHFVDFEESSLKKGLTKEECRILDQEANAFADEVIAPDIILFLMQCHDNSVSVHNICSISYEAAVIKVKHFYNVVYIRLNEVKRQLIRQFRKYMYEFYKRNVHFKKTLCDIKFRSDSMGQYVCWD